MSSTTPAETPAQPGRLFTFARNMGWSMGAQVVVWGVAFVVTPYLVRSMGTETYGLYILLFTVSSYLMLMTLSSSSATVKYMAEFRARGESRGLRGALVHSSAINAIGGFVGGAAVFAGAHFVAVRVFHVPDGDAELAVWVLRCAAVGTMFAALAQVSNSVLQAFSRFDWYNALTLAQNALFPIGAAAIVRWGGGLRGVATWFAILNAAVFAGSFAASARLLAAFRPSSEGPALPARDFWSYTLTAWLGQLAWIASNQFDRLFIARRLSLEQLTLYAVPANLVMRLQFIPAALGSVFFPLIPDFAVRGESELRAKYLSLVRALLWAVLPGLIVLFWLMPQFLSLWLGPRFSQGSVWPARWLILAQAAALLYYLPNAVAAGLGHPRYPTILAWAQAALSVAGWQILIPRYGILGVGVTAFLAQALTVPVLLPAAHSLFGLSWSDYLRGGLARPFMCAAALCAFLLPLHVWAQSWTRLVVLSLAAGIAYAAATWATLTRDDREVVRLLWSRLR